jgi:hypothetical protein
MILALLFPRLHSQCLQYCVELRCLPSLQGMVTQALYLVKLQMSLNLIYCPNDCDRDALNVTADADMNIFTLLDAV